MNKTEENGEFANTQQWEGTTLRGEVIDVTGENPVIKPIQPAPLVIVNEERAQDYERGDMLAVEIENAKETYMFGRKVEQRNQEKPSDYRVRMVLAGHEFTSKAFREETVADSVCEYVEENVTKHAEVVRKR